jgi:small-conductance mechanosensitive channel
MFHIPAEVIKQSWSLLGAVIGTIVVVGLVATVHHFAVKGILVLQGRFKFSAHVAKTAQRLTTWSAVVLAVLVVLGRFRMIDNAWALISAALALVGVGFVAMWSILSNMLCALLLVIVEPFQVGDTVEIVGQNVRGQVEDFNLFFTTLRGEQDEMIQVPNNIFFQTPIRRLRKQTPRSHG